MTIDQAKQVLKDAGFYTDNLWSIEDVKSQYKCTDEEAYEVLDDAFNNDGAMERIWEDIDSAANYNDLLLNSEE